MVGPRVTDNVLVTTFSGEMNWISIVWRSPFAGIACEIINPEIALFLKKSSAYSSGTRLLAVPNSGKRLECLSARRYAARLNNKDRLQLYVVGRKRHRIGDLVFRT